MLNVENYKLALGSIVEEIKRSLMEAKRGDADSVGNALAYAESLEIIKDHFLSEESVLKEIGLDVDIDKELLDG
jgi:hemerythrin-like domain-containing protein